MRASAINAALDRVPRDVILLGGRELPAFRSIGIAGFHVALVVTIAAAVRTGLPIVDAIALSATAALSFFAYALVRRAITRREEIVLLEHVAAAAAAVWLYLWAAGAPLRSGADVLAVGLCAFLAVGRTSCLTVGCCHGHPSPIGVVYGPGAVPRRLAGVRLLPVPLIESAALAAIGAVGFALAGGRPGVAAVWCAAAYATVRFGTEALRGDARPAVFGFSVPRLAAMVTLALALVASEAWLVDAPFRGRRGIAVAVVLAVTALGGAILDVRRRDPLASARHADEVWTAIESLARRAPLTGEPTLGETSRGVVVAVSWAGTGLHVSFSHASRRVAGIAGLLGLGVVARTATAVHVVVPTARVGVVPAPSTPVTAPIDPPQPAPSAATEHLSPFRAEAGYFGGAVDA